MNFANPSSVHFFRKACSEDPEVTCVSSSREEHLLRRQWSFSSFACSDLKLPMVCWRAEFGLRDCSSTRYPQMLSRHTFVNRRLQREEMMSQLLFNCRISFKVARICRSLSNRVWVKNEKTVKQSNNECDDSEADSNRYQELSPWQQEILMQNNLKNKQTNKHKDKKQNTDCFDIKLEKASLSCRS